jgi:adenylylsulfate kinase
MRILVMGLPGSGKTKLAEVLAKKLNAAYFNADEVRAQFNDWEFSPEARDRQAKRMRDLSLMAFNTYDSDYVVCDFVCPTENTREIFDADYTIFMDTITLGRFEDTNKMFMEPSHCDYVIKSWGDVESQVADIISNIQTITGFNTKAPTGLMIGRFQPFHDGHLKLFEEILEREGQVCIVIRDTQGTDEKNPFDIQTVTNNIHIALKKHRGKYMIIWAPNITGVYYGRDVGYKVEQIHLAPEIESISATDIRKQMGI